MKIILFLLLAVTSSLSLANKLHVAVASNFAPPMKALATEFENETGHKVLLSFGSSGKFFAQIIHGAPFQIFFSADQLKPKALEQRGLTVDNTRFTYAIGALALWSASRNAPVEHQLTSGNFNKLSIANPKLAPYGAAAIEVLHNLNLWKPTEKKIVYGENIAQTFQFTRSGNAELGLVALSQLMSHDHAHMGSSWIIPETLYNPIKQDAVLLKPGANSDAARAFLNFIQSESAKDIIETFGYKTSPVEK